MKSAARLTAWNASCQDLAYEETREVEIEAGSRVLFWGCAMRRRTMTNIIFVLAILACLSGSANAAATANEYRENCHQYLDNKDSGKAGLCLGYAAGFMDGVSGAKFTSKDTLYTVSFREGVTAKQVLLAVVAYIDKHPEILHRPIWSVFIDALMESKLLVATPDKDLHSHNVQ